MIANLNTCTCNHKSEYDCIGEYQTNRQQIRLDNNAGSPAQLQMLKKMEVVFSRVEPENYFTYFNANEDESTNLLAADLRKTIAIREGIEGTELTFFAGGYSFLNILMATMQPNSSLTMEGDFVGYKKTARPQTKTYEAEATMDSMISRAEIIKPEVILFTDGETNPGLAPIDSVSLARELRRASPDSLLLIDQVYGRHHGDDLRINKLAIEDDNTIFLRCAAKDTGVVGLRIAWTITLPDGKADKLVKMLLAPYDIGMDIAWRTLALYKEPELLNDAADIQNSARIRAANILQQKGIEIRAGQSPWILFRPKIDSEKAVDLLKARNVFLQLQDPLHDSLKGMIRVSTTTCSDMERFCQEAEELGII